MKFSMKKLIGLLVFLVMAFALSAANLDELRWVPKNREALSKLIDENKNQGNYVVFDWDYTSIYQDTQENLFRYQIDNLKFKMTPAQFSKAIRKDIPLDNFAKDYVNVKGQPINITKIANDLDKRYTFLYNNYIKTQKMSLEKIKQTEEFKDFRGKLAFLYEAIGGSFSHDVAYPWVLYLFENMSVSEVQKLAKEANDFGIGNKLGKYVLESSDKLTGEAGKVSHQYKSGLRTQPETANLFHEFEKNGKKPIIGKYFQNIEEIVKDAKELGFIEIVKDKHEIIEYLRKSENVDTRGFFEKNNEIDKILKEIFD